MAAVATKPRSATILIAGTSKSPSSVKVSDKTRANGTYLNGVRCDLKNMEDFVRSDYRIYGTLSVEKDSAGPYQ